MLKNIEKDPIRIFTSTHQYWPHWFSIKNYTCLEKLTIEEFFTELDYRLWLYHQQSFPSGRKPRDDKTWHMIEKGFPIISSPSIINTNQRQCDTAITLNQIDILTISTNIQLQQLSSQSSVPVESQNCPLVISLDLNTADNTTLLKDIEYLINKARIELNAPEPKYQSSKKLSEKTLKKLLLYKVIPHLDLLIFSGSHKLLPEHEWKPLSLTQGALVSLLFNNDIDTEQFKDTYKKFYHSLLATKINISRLRSNVFSDKELLSRQIGNL